MEYTKIRKHQAILKQKSAALKTSGFSFSKATMRVQRLTVLNCLIMERLLVLNEQAMNEVVEDFATNKKLGGN